MKPKESASAAQRGAVPERNHEGHEATRRHLRRECGFALFVFLRALRGGKPRSESVSDTGATPSRRRATFREKRSTMLHATRHRPRATPGNPMNPRRRKSSLFPEIGRAHV